MVRRGSHVRERRARLHEDLQVVKDATYLASQQAAMDAATAAKVAAEEATELQGKDIDHTMATSRTHHAAWMRFHRLSKNRKKFLLELTGELSDDRLGLFREWLKMGESIECMLKFRRTAKRSDELETKFCYAKKRDLMALPWNLPEAKATLLCQKAEHFQYFPDDEEEKMYWVHKSINGKRKKMTKDVVEITGQQWLQEDEVHDLLANDGLLGNDIGPLTDLQEDGLDFVEDQKTKRVRHKPKPIEDATVEESQIKEQTPEQINDACMQKILKEITEAQAYHLKITGSPSPFAASICNALQGYIGRKEELY